MNGDHLNQLRITFEANLLLCRINTTAVFLCFVDVLSEKAQEAMAAFYLLRMLLQ